MTMEKIFHVSFKTNYASSHRTEFDYLLEIWTKNHARYNKNDHENKNENVLRYMDTHLYENNSLTMITLNVFLRKLC